MSEPFLGEIRAVPFNFAPTGWALCNGQLMAIAQNTALFSLLGTYYGGNGTSTFALPNLQARFAVHSENGAQSGGLEPVALGEQGGSATVTLTQQSIPAHTHTPAASTASGNTNSPAGAVWAEALNGRVGAQLYATSGTVAPMAVLALGATGGSQPHNNMPPYLGLTFVIALQGIYPARS